MIITTNYKSLKLCKHGLSTWDAMLSVALQVTNEYMTSIKGSSIKDLVIEKIGLPKMPQQMELDSGESIIRGRISWMLSELPVGGLL